MAVMLERFDLVDAAERRALTYSGGMKRRLDLAMTLDEADQLADRIGVLDGGGSRWLSQPRSRD